jgi:hypothetical protein
MDGTIIDYKKYNPKSKKVVIQFKLSKQRKIDELRNLLNSLDIPFTFRKSTISGCNKLQPYFIRIYGDEARRIYDLLHYKKELPKEFRLMNKEELDVFLETLLLTDGNKKDSMIQWTSISKDNVDIIQQACICNSIPFKYTILNNASGFKSDKLQYHSSIYNNDFLDGTIKVNKIKYNDIVYCFEMPKGTLITRLNGKVAFTGNCRLQKYINHNAPELSWVKALQLERILGLEEHKIKYVKKRWIEYKGVIYSHMDKANKYGGYTAKNIGVDLSTSVVHTHSHKVGHVQINDRHFYDNGCLCDVDAPYLEGPSLWGQAFMVVQYIDGKPYFTQIPIQDHKFLLEGKLFTPDGIKSIKNKNGT